MAPVDEFAQSFTLYGPTLATGIGLNNDNNSNESAPVLGNPPANIAPAIESSITQPELRPHDQIAPQPWRQLVQLNPEMNQKLCCNHNVNNYDKLGTAPGTLISSVEQTTKLITNELAPISSSTPALVSVVFEPTASSRNENNSSGATTGILTPNIVGWDSIATKSKNNDTQLDANQYGIFDTINGAILPTNENNINTNNHDGHDLLFDGVIYGIDDTTLDRMLAEQWHNLTDTIFDEFYEKNLSNILTNHSNPLVGVSMIERPAEVAFSVTTPAGGPMSSANATSADGLGALATGHPTLGPLLGAPANHTPRPYLGDAFYSFQTVYWPIHCVIALVICTLGIFANVTNIIVLTRPNMITAVNTILSAIALSDLVVNISTIPYLVHEFSDSTNVTSYFSYEWALYILFHAHTSVTAHTISIWLTCVLATWRYFVVCRSRSANQRNWSVSLAKRAIVAVALFVPVFCIPDYLSFAIIKETADNATLYKVGFSSLADQSQFIKTFHFSIFSCLTKLVPCVLLTFFTTVLIRKLLKARERRLRLTAFGKTSIKDADNLEARETIANGNGPVKLPQITRTSKQSVEANDENDETIDVPRAHIHNSTNGLLRRDNGDGDDDNVDHLTQDLKTCDNGSGGGRGKSACCVDSKMLQMTGQSERQLRPNEGKTTLDGKDREQLFVPPDIGIVSGSRLICGHQSGSSMTTDGELVGMSSDSITSGMEQGISNYSGKQSAQIKSQLIVESSGNSAAKTTTAAMPPLTNGTGELNQHRHHTSIQIDLSNHYSSEQRELAQLDHEQARSISTSGVNLSDLENRQSRQCCSVDHAKQQQHHEMDSQTALLQPRVRSSQDLSKFGAISNSGKGLIGFGSAAGGCSTNNLVSGGDQKDASRFSEKRASESALSTNRGRSLGSTTIAPFQMVKLHATQRQLSQNETTTRLLIAVMIVFLICEFPAGILAALCAILGQDFFENVYQPTGILTDLLALINSSVNFILYCFMSTQFRVTFYQVVLHCPAPTVPHSHN